MDELKALFGEESIDYATFEQKCKDGNIKLANLSGGGYIAKGKYDDLNKQFTQYKTDNDVSKYADYDTIKAENETLKAEKETNERLKDIAKANVSEKYRKFVLSEVKKMVTDKKDFATCLTEYLKENNQFIEEVKKTGFFQKGSTQVDLQGKSTNEKSTNRKMNELLRGKR